MMIVVCKKIEKKFKKKSIKITPSVPVYLSSIPFLNVSKYCSVFKKKIINLLIFLLYPYFIFKTI